MTAPSVTVEIAFDAGYATDPGARTWTDVTAYVDGSLAINVGRSDELAQADVNTLTLTLDNRDGRFTPGLTTSPHYPNVKLGRPIRVTATPSGQSAQVRFFGYVEDLQVAWPGASDRYSTVTVTASSGLARMGRSAPLAGLPTVEGFADREYVGEYVALSSDFGVLQRFGAGAAPTFESVESAPVTDELELATFAAGGWLQGRDDPDLVAFVFTTTTPDAGYLFGYFTDNAASPYEAVRVKIANNVLVLELDNSGVVTTGTGTTLVTDGELHSILVDIDGRVYLDGSTTAEIDLFTSSVSGDGQFHFGGAVTYDGITPSTPSYTGSLGRVAWVTTGPDDTFPAYHDVFVSGFAGDGPAARLRRYANYAGVDVVTSSDASINGRFLTDITGWAATAGAGTATWVASPSKGSVGSAKLATTFVGPVFIQLERQSPFVAVQAGVEYRAWAWVIGGDAARSAGIQIEFKDSGLANVGQTAGAEVDTDPTLAEWRLVEVTATAPAGAVWAMPKVFFTAQGGDDFYIDGIFLTPTTGTPIAHLPTAGRAPLELMRDVEAVDGGVLFDAADGTLTYQDRSYRYNATSVLTFDASTQEVEADFAPKLDRSTLINEATATTADGYEYTYTDTASQDDYGQHSDSRQLATTSRAEAEGWATWTVNAYSEPASRAPTVSVDITPDTGARQAAVLGLEIGDRVTISNLPAQAASSSQGFFVEGYAETIVEGVLHQLTFNLSPTSPWDSIFRLDDPSLGQLDAGIRLGR